MLFANVRGQETEISCAGCADFGIWFTSLAWRLSSLAIDRPGGVFHLSTPAKLPTTALDVRMGIPGRADWECAGDP